jgi:L-2-hydroxyglutarate oxidase LhgO
MRLFKSFIDITNPDAIPSTNIIKCKKMLTVVKRSSCSKLTKLCKMVRSNQIKPVELLDQLGYMYIESDLTKNEPNVATNEFLHNKRILTYRNIDVDEFAGADEFNTFDHFMAIKSFNIKQNGVAMQFYTNEYFTLIDG